MRLFVAIELPDPIRQQLNHWLPESRYWRKTVPERLHLTLLFLGEYTEAEKEKIHIQLSGIRFAPFELEISGIGAFPDWKAPTVLWAGVRTHSQLMELQVKIQTTLSEYTDGNSCQSYLPHITLARCRSHSSSLQNFIKKNRPAFDGILTFDVKRFQLKESRLKPQGAEHRVLYRYGAWSSGR